MTNPGWRPSASYSEHWRLFDVTDVRSKRRHRVERWTGLPVDRHPARPDAMGFFRHPSGHHERLALRVEDLDRAELGENVTNLRRVADGDDLKTRRIPVLLRRALCLLGRDGRDPRRIRVPVIRRQSELPRVE